MSVWGVPQPASPAGDDEVRTIVDLAVDRFRHETGIDLRREPHALERLTEAARQARIDLSSQPETMLQVPFIVADENGTKNLHMTLTRAELQAEPQRGAAPPAPYGDPYWTPPQPPVPQHDPSPPAAPAPYGTPARTPPQFMPTTPAVVARPAGRALGIASLILGTVAIVAIFSILATGAAGFVVWVLAGFVGLILGLVAVVQRRSGWSLSGLIVSATGITVGILLIIIGLLVGG